MGGLNEIAQMIESAKVLADPAKFAAAAKAASVELHIFGGIRKRSLILDRLGTSPSYDAFW